MKIKMRIFLILGILGILFQLTSCRKADQESKTPNVLNLALTSEVSTLDPANSYDTVSGAVVYQIYETLFQYHYLKRPYTLEPLLANGEPLIKDEGRKYIFKIKPNIRYHDDPCFQGQPRFVKAQDFITQIKRLAFLPTTSNGWWLFDGKIKGLNEFRDKAGRDLENLAKMEVEGLKAPDDLTLEIELTSPNPQLLYALAMTHTAPVPFEVVKCYDNLLAHQSVGTGPFYLKNKASPNFIELERFAHYRDDFYPSSGDRYANNQTLLKDAGKKIPFLDGINFHVIKDSQTRWLNFLSKKIDMMAIRDNINVALTPTGELSAELKAKKALLQVAPTLTYWWLAFNMKDAVVGPNVKLRLAIAHAIDMDKFIHLFTNKAAQKANSIYPPGIPGYNPSNKLSFEYNLEKAKALLAEAGYPEGKGLPALTYDVRGSDTVRRQEAEFIKAELKKIGIEVNIMTNSFPGFLGKERSGNLQFWQGGWALDYPDSENILQLLTTQNFPPGPNASHFSNKRFDELYEKLKLLPNGTEKFKLMEEMEELVNRELPWVMMYYARNYVLYHNHLLNFRYSDLANNYLKYLKIKKE